MIIFIALFILLRATQPNYFLFNVANLGGSTNVTEVDASLLQLAPKRQASAKHCDKCGRFTPVAYPEKTAAALEQCNKCDRDERASMFIMSF